MVAACFTGLLYFAVVFALAFAMGVARVLVIAPRIGPVAAVLVEVPVLVAVSWIVARRLLRDRGFSLTQRAAMGATAFALTMASEAALAVFMNGQGLSDWAAALATPLGLVGLAGQIAFAALPMLLGREQAAGRRSG